MEHHNDSHVNAMPNDHFVEVDLTLRMGLPSYEGGRQHKNEGNRGGEGAVVNNTPSSVRLPSSWQVSSSPAAAAVVVPPPHYYYYYHNYNYNYAATPPASFSGSTRLGVTRGGDDGGHNFINKKQNNHWRRSRGFILICHECTTTTTPMWRRGPHGPQTLCNACGLRYARDVKKATNMAMPAST